MVYSLPKDIEQYLFVNQLKQNEDGTTKLSSLQDSQMLIMDAIDLKNKELVSLLNPYQTEKLWDLVEKNMFFEWSSTALSQYL